MSGGGGDRPQDVYGGLQRGELALAPRVGGQEAGLAGYRAAQETGSKGDAARGSSADFGWREHEEYEERSVTAVVEYCTEGRGAAPLPRQAQLRWQTNPACLQTKRREMRTRYPTNK